jgi:alpha-beta hydrolase superfamily lysophospholipase
VTAGLLLVLAWHAAQRWMVSRMEESAFEVKPDGPQNPALFGVPYKDQALQVGDHVIHTRLVRSSVPGAPALLIFHGNGESISDWAQVQARLSHAGLTTMVFDYSGFGNSSGHPTVVTLHADALAAYQAFLGALPAGTPTCVMGHSLGNAVMLDALQALRPLPHAVVVHAGFTSAKEYAVQSGMVSDLTAKLLPDLWDNAHALTHTPAPVLIMHSDTDEVIPVGMGRSLAQAAGSHGRFELIHHAPHDQLYLNPTDAEWNPILRFCSHT